MSWLGQWLKEIIMIILLATFIDLLLPNRTMQRYVKLMLSLIILLTLLSPVLKLFDAKVTDELAEQWNAMLSSGTEAAGSDRTSLANIQQQGEQLARERQADALRLAALEIGSRMKEQLGAALRSADEPDSEPDTLHALHAEVTDVDVVLARDSKKGQPVIERITVLMKETAHMPSSPSAGAAPESRETLPPSPIEPIENVRRVEKVHIDATQRDGSDSSSIAASAPDVPASATAPHQQAGFGIEQRTIRELTSSWLVSPEQISIQWTDKGQTNFKKRS
ncbi:stage III sporulation protein AF [Paenibacillus apiarius]|uniref:stage III sporulation protein AF n=1 Tax=Paenibacillus apiarius TaxID=46240 RepID=UPI003B3BDB2B